MAIPKAPPFAPFTDDLSPGFKVAVNGELIDALFPFITELSVDYVDGLTWSTKLTVEDTVDFRILSSKVFQHENELDIWMGYGTALRHMGRFIVVKLDPDFPQDGVVKLSVVGHTAEFRMKENAPDGSVGRAAVLPKGVKRTPDPKKSHSRAFVNQRYDEAIDAICEAPYGFDTGDIDPVTMAPQTFHQVVSVSDWDMVRAMANLSGFLFWVDGDEKGKWKAHFRDPEKLFIPNINREVIQKAKYTFKYGDGSASLLSFSPEGVLVHERTRLRVAFTDPKTGKMVEHEVDENGDAPDLLFEGDIDDKVASVLGPSGPAGGAIRILFGDHTVDTVADRRFSSGEEATRWAAQWFRRNRENFQSGRGRLIGFEELRCFQIHTLTGIGPYSGDWYFTQVEHKISRDSGYVTDFHARKVVR